MPKARYRREREMKYGPNAPDMRGRHSNHARGPDHYRWRGGNPKPDHAKRLANAKASQRRHPDRYRARQKVEHEVRMGRMPAARTLACADCGGQANSYDHHQGYAPPHEMTVEPVCFKCHGLRSRRRGEHRVPHPGARK